MMLALVVGAGTMIGGMRLFFVVDSAAVGRLNFTSQSTPASNSNLLDVGITIFTSLGTWSCTTFCWRDVELPAFAFLINRDLFGCLFIFSVSIAFRSMSDSESEPQFREACDLLIGFLCLS